MTELDPLQRTNLRGAIDYGILTIRSLILVNGAGAVGLLTFYGNAAEKGAVPVNVGSLTVAIILFGLGVFAAITCSIAAYLSQIAVGAVTGPKHIEQPARIVAIIFGLISVSLFLAGIIIAARAFDGKVVKVEPALPEYNAMRTLSFSRTIPGVTDGPFPLRIDGMLKLGGGLETLKIDVTLGSAGNKEPTPADQAAFAEQIQRGTIRLTAINLQFLDQEGFLARDNLTIPFPGAGWTQMLDPWGVTGSDARLYEYLSRAASDRSVDVDIKSVNVQWNAVPPAAPTPPHHLN